MARRADGRVNSTDRTKRYTPDTFEDVKTRSQLKEYIDARSRNESSEQRNDSRR